MSTSQQNLGMQMQSVSDPKSSHMISPTHHTSRFKPSKIVRWPNNKQHGTGRKSNNSSSSSSSLMPQHPYDMNDEDPSSKSNSPYYKGLTDQSLAILDNDLPHTHTPPSYHHHHHPNTSTTNLFSSSSPYYKGLTDYSLVTASWSPASMLHNHHPTNSISSCESSPYYRGLIDYSLALHTTNSHFSINIKTSATQQDITLKELMVKMAQDDICDDVSFVIQDKKPVRERVSKEIKVDDEKTTLEEMELITNRIDIDDDVEEKPLREKESEASKVGIVLEEDAEKTISEDMDLITRGGSGNDVGLVIEEEKVESVLKENTDKTAKGVDDVRLVIEEKPLRERVSEEGSNVNAEMSVLEEMSEKTISKEMDLVKEEELKDLSLFEQRVASELASKDVTQKLKEEGNVYEYIWATKYQPMTLAEFICNRDKALELKELVREGCGCNHFIFEGPANVGKRSMIRAMLREVFGADRVQIIEECKEFNLKGEMIGNLQVRIKKSLHHVEVNMSETKGYEKHVIADIFKETYGKIINNSLSCSPENCQAIVLYEAEKLSTESMLYIKWLLEKHKGCNKVFFCCSDETKLQLVKPLCTRIRLSPPTSDEILKILEYVGKEEGINLSRDLVKKIILMSKNNLRQALRSLEATYRNKDDIKEDDLILTGWEDDISNIAINIIKEQSPRQLYVIRRKLQNLMIHDVSPDFIYKSLVERLMSLIDDSLRLGVAKLNNEYNKANEIKFETMKQFSHARNKQGESNERNEPTKKNTLSYLKVEEFIAKFMSWYKNSHEKSNKHVQLIIGSVTAGADHDQDRVH